MIRSRILILILSLVMTAAGTPGCSSSNKALYPPAAETKSPEATESPSAGSAGKEKTVVDVFQYKPGYANGLTEAAKEFAKDNKDIVVNIQTVGEGQDYGAALRAKFNSNVAPAIFNIRNPKNIEEWKDKLLDLSGMEAAKNVIDGLLEGVTTEGKVYGLPYSLEGYGIIYNKKIFEEAEINIKDIDSFEVFADTAKKLDKKKEQLKLDAVFALPAKETEALGLYLSNIYIAPDFNNNVFTTNQAKVLEFKHSDEFKQMLDLQNQYSVQPSAEIDYKKQVVELFVKGKVAMIQQGNWAYEAIETADKEIARLVGFMPYPALGKGDTNPVGVPMYWAFNSSKPEEVQKAAKDFINWLYLSQSGGKVITEKLKFIPPFKGFSADTVKDPLSKSVLNQASAGKTTNWVFAAYPQGWPEKLGEDIKLYLKNELPWEKVVKNAKDSWAEARK